jgi:DNA-binding response OmpR family regulator
MGGIGRRILVVDDHMDASETLAILLRAAGHDVMVARDGVSALQNAGTFDPDVVFLDIGLPGMNGFEVARRLREKDQKPIVVAISGYGSHLDRKQAQDVGIEHYFIKPVGLDTLRELLATLPLRR